MIITINFWIFIITIIITFDLSPKVILVSSCDVEPTFSGQMWLKRIEKLIMMMMIENMMMMENMVIIENMMVMMMVMIRCCCKN